MRSVDGTRRRSVRVRRGGFWALCLLVFGGFQAVEGRRVAADIYLFEDENGVVHISNVPVDPRFRFKLRESPDSKEAPASLYAEGRTSYDGLIQEVARKKEVDPDLLHAVVQVESAYDADALSSKGAIGLMQLMPETASRVGVLDPFHPAQNLEGGAEVLKALLEKYAGNLSLALAAYNAGEAAVDRYQEVPPYPETQAYVRKVLDLYRSQDTAAE